MFGRRKHSDQQSVNPAYMNRLRVALASLALLVLPGFFVLAGPASATFIGRNGRMAWAVFNAGGGGGGGFASLTTYPAHPSHGKQIGDCPEDNEGNVCSSWQNVTYSPDGKHLLWDHIRASGTEVITLANADGSNPQPTISDSFDDSQASFSRDGDKIIYVRQTKSPGGLFGTLVIRNLSDGNTRVVRPSIPGEPAAVRAEWQDDPVVCPDKYGDPAGCGPPPRRSWPAPAGCPPVGVRHLPQRKVDRLRHRRRRRIHRKRGRKPGPANRQHADRRPPHQRGPLLPGRQAHRFRGAGIDGPSALRDQDRWQHAAADFR